jgi:hypothetical protein
MSRFKNTTEITDKFDDLLIDEFLFTFAEFFDDNFRFAANPPFRTIGDAVSKPVDLNFNPESFTSGALVERARTMPLNSQIALPAGPIAEATESIASPNKTLTQYFDEVLERIEKETDPTKKQQQLDVVKKNIERIKDLQAKRHSYLTKIGFSENKLSSLADNNPIKAQLIKIFDEYNQTQLFLKSQSYQKFSKLIAPEIKAVAANPGIKQLLSKFGWFGKALGPALGIFFGLFETVELGSYIQNNGGIEKVWEDTNLRAGLISRGMVIASVAAGFIPVAGWLISAAFLLIGELGKKQAAEYKTSSDKEAKSMYDKGKAHVEYLIATKPKITQQEIEAEIKKYYSWATNSPHGKQLFEQLISELPSMMQKNSSQSTMPYVAPPVGGMSAGNYNPKTQQWEYKQIANNYNRNIRVANVNLAEASLDIIKTLEGSGYYKEADVMRNYLIANQF